MTASKPPSPSTKPAEPSPWTEGDISIRKGSCNVLLIAPHGHPDNDARTYSITRHMADALDCFAIVNKTFRKPLYRKNPDGTYVRNKEGKRVRHDPDKLKKWVNLNRRNQVQKFLEAEFESPLNNAVSEILHKFDRALVLWIHGMQDGHLTPENTANNATDKDALIGIGQNREYRRTANEETVAKLISALESNPSFPINAAKAKKGSGFCGWHKNIMNQYFLNCGYSLSKVESIQIELKRTGFRQKANFTATGKAMAKAVKRMMSVPETPASKPVSDSAVQKGTIQQIKVSDIDPKNNQFMARIDDIKSSATKFRDLVTSIKNNGLLNNIIVRKQQSNSSKPYQLISGFRRIAALQKALSKKELANATVPARVLSEGVSDDEAYQISFTENLARDDLSLWEIANACAKIKESMDDGSKSLGEIESHLSGLIQKDTRTVRRYLKLASIKDNDLIEAIHTGIITATDALEIGKKDIIKDDPKSISALMLHLKKKPKTTREFIRFYQNLEYCFDLSGLSLAEILECKYADEFLSLDNKVLSARIEYLHQSSGQSYSDVLRGKAGSLIKNPEDIKNGLEKKQINNKFQQDYATLTENVVKAFEQSDIAGKFKIKPNLNSSDNQVSVTITAPEGQIWQALEAVYDVKVKPNLPNTEKAKNKSKSRSSNQQNKSKNSDERSPREDSKQVFRGEFES